MRRNLPILLALTITGVALTAAAGRDDPDERAIRQHIERYYFEGVRNSDTAAAHKAFHPSVARMLFLENGAFAERTIPDWLARIAEGAPNPPRPDTFARRVVAVDVSGGAAMAKLELRYADAVITDYMSLLKVNGAWTIVGKIFDRQPVQARANGRRG